MFYILEIHNRVATSYHAWICKMDWLTTSLQKVGLDIVPLKLSSSFSNIKVRKIWTKRFFYVFVLLLRLGSISFFSSINSWSWEILVVDSKILLGGFDSCIDIYIWKYIIKIKYIINCFWPYLYPLRNKNCYLNQIATHFF